MNFEIIFLNDGFRVVETSASVTEFVVVDDDVAVAVVAVVAVVSAVAAVAVTPLEAIE